MDVRCLNSSSRRDIVDLITHTAVVFRCSLGSANPYLVVYSRVEWFLLCSGDQSTVFKERSFCYLVRRLIDREAVCFKASYPRETAVQFEQQSMHAHTGTGTGYFSFSKMLFDEREGTQVLRYSYSTFYHLIF